MSEVTKDDLRDTRDTILQEMRDGFRGVHTRQDTTNGRVKDGELQGQTHAVKIRNLERETFGRHDAKPADEPDRTLTERDFKMIKGAVIGTLMAIASLIAFLKTAGPALAKLVSLP